MADPGTLSAPPSGAPRIARLAITWSIPDDYGGMTSAMLHRSRALARATGSTIDVLTFEPRGGFDEVRARLTARGELTDGVRLRNLYEELAVRAGGGTVAEVRRISDGTDALSRIEHRRSDGSLAVLDERSTSNGGRRLTAFDADGSPVDRWPGAWACYRDWIERIRGGAPTVAVVDSKTMAPFVAGLSRPGLATVHVVHASHLSGTARPYGPIRPSRAAALAAMERFDAVVFLTERQRDDAVRLLGDPGNLVVIRNGRTRPDGARSDGGTRAGGVIVGGLTARKRVEDAIEIAAIAARDRRDDPGVRLTIVGDGPERTRLERVAESSGAATVFTGHLVDGAAAFADASWMLLTSRSEGSPLVLAEAMARGCVPIAYDVPYGPADLIEDGVNGFLVADGDRESAARSIARLARATPAERDAMRAAARRTSEQFDDGVVTASWLGLEREALARAAVRRVAFQTSEPARVRLRLRRGRIRLTAQLVDPAPTTEAIVTFRAVGTTRIVRRQSRPRRHGRLLVRLERAATALLAGHGRIEVTLQLTDRHTSFQPSVTRLHPDRRSLPRRVLGRLRQNVQRTRTGGATRRQGLD